MLPHFLTISGSPSSDSANSRFLAALADFTDSPLVVSPNIANLPLFQPERDQSPWPESIVAFRSAIAAARGVVICTPAYLHNIPGVLKNALDWLASSGEFDEKPTLVLTLTPGPPRGERARQSLLWSLEALNARVVAEAGIHRADVTYDPNGCLLNGDTLEMIVEGMKLLG